MSLLLAALFGLQAQQEELMAPHLQHNGCIDVGACMQVFEQLFQAHEQRWPDAAADDFLKDMYVDPRKYPYDCPGDQHLQLSYYTVPRLSPTTNPVIKNGLVVLGLVLPLAFMGIALGLGIFRCFSLTLSVRLC